MVLGRFSFRIPCYPENSEQRWEALFRPAHINCCPVRLMPRAQSPHPPTLHARLSARRLELEQTALARIHSIPGPAIVSDPAYLDGVRGAITAALDYGLDAVASLDSDSEPVPVELLGQARLAARNGVNLDAVLRRYGAGYSLFADAVLEEAAAVDCSVADMRSVLHSLSDRFSRIVSTVAEEYRREAKAFPRDTRRRQIQLLRRLIAGESLAISDLNYDLRAHHLGFVASGLKAGEALRAFAERFDRQLLFARPDGQVAWAWLGGRRPFEPPELDLITGFRWPQQTAIACGEPGQGLAGWRLTHRQAAAALPVAQRGAIVFVQYADVALLASVIQDELLSTSLRRLYLDPLEDERDGGETMRRTLRAYFAARGNASSAAAALGVNRRTVSSRLAVIENRFGRSLDRAAIEINTALRLDELVDA